LLSVIVLKKPLLEKGPQSHLLGLVRLRAIDTTTAFYAINGLQHLPILDEGGIKAKTASTAVQWRNARMPRVGCASRIASMTAAIAMPLH
jgi:hypothetical protein